MDESKTKLQAKVLVVDSNRSNLDRVARALRDAGLQVVALSRLGVAPPLYNVVRPDAAVVACRLPDPSGISAARRLRQLSKGTLPLFYVLDAPDEEGRRYLLERARGTDVLIQPIDCRELIAKLKAQVELKSSIEKVVSESSAPALNDQSSGVRDRAFLTALIEHEARRAERHGGSFAVLVGVLAGFEQLKKTLGAEWSDRIVAHAAQVFRRNTRECDVLAKLDQAEFGLCLPGASREGLPFLRHRLLSSFDASPLRLEGRVLRPSVLVGAASFPETVSSACHLLRAAYQDLRRPRGSVRAPSAPGLAL